MFTRDSLCYILRFLFLNLNNHHYSEQTHRSWGTKCWKSISQVDKITNSNNFSKVLSHRYKIKDWYSLVEITTDRLQPLYKTAAHLHSVEIARGRTVIRYVFVVMAVVSAAREQDRIIGDVGKIVVYDFCASLLYSPRAANRSIIFS